MHLSKFSSKCTAYSNTDWSAYSLTCFVQVEEWAKAPPSEEAMELDLEKPTNGYGANLNVDTSAHEEEESAFEAVQEPPPQMSANPFTGGQTSNPFRQ